MIEITSDSAADRPTKGGERFEPDADDLGVMAP
jgi:hypothetical protein